MGILQSSQWIICLACNVGAHYNFVTTKIICCVLENLFSLFTLRVPTWYLDICFVKSSTSELVSLLREVIEFRSDMSLSKSLSLVQIIHWLVSMSHFCLGIMRLYISKYICIILIRLIRLIWAFAGIKVWGYFSELEELERKCSLVSFSGSLVVLNIINQIIFLYFDCLVKLHLAVLMGTTI